MNSPRKPIIQSLGNPQVKHVRLLRKASERRETGSFLIDGQREIELAIEHDIRIETLFHAGDPGDLPSIPASQRQEVTSAVMQRISYGERSDTPVAVAKTPELGLDRVDLASDSLVLVLDRTEKPGNLGACLRSASACGVAVVVLTDPICEVFNPNTIRASRGTVFTVPIAVATPSEILERCAVLGMRVMCARTGAVASLWECKFSDGCAVVFGNEAEGLGLNWDTLAPESFSIPMQGVADSLNLSISAAVTMYEAVRQRCTR